MSAHRIAAAVVLVLLLAAGLAGRAGAEASPPDSQAALAEVFAAFPGLSGVTVEVVHHVARLGGSVATPEQAERAVALAESRPGIELVTSDIVVSAEVSDRLAPLVDRLGQALARVWEALPLVLLALGVMALFVLLSVLAARWKWLYARASRNNVLIRSLLSQLVRALTLLAGLVVVLDLLGLSGAVGAVVGAAGLFGLALGFGLREIIENYLSGVLLSVRAPFTLEDWLAVGEHEGSVVRMTSRELVLMNLSGNHIRIPNTQVFKSVIYNYTRNPLRRFTIEVGVGTGEDLRLVQEVGTGALARMKGVQDDPPPMMRALSLADFNVAVAFSGWVDQGAFDFLKVRSEAVRLIKDALDAAGIEMPVPTQQLSVRRVVPDEEAALAPVQPDAEHVMQEAEHADVDREAYLDRQIEQDRETSGEQDLLGKG